jgi:hypothetical protein
MASRTVSSSLRAGAALAVVLATGLAAAGCGGAHKARPAEATVTRTSPPAAARDELLVGLVGPLALDVAGVVTERGTLEEVGDAPLVLVSAQTSSLAAVAAAARAHPRSHFALVGSSTKGDRAPNLVGIVMSDDQAARLGGIVAGDAAAEAGGTTPRVAWVGPQDDALATAFARGAHSALPAVVVLVEPSTANPAQCKEASLAAIARGAMVVMAHEGLCAEAAISGAHQQNVPGLELGDFQFPEVVANLIARAAAGGLFHGGEDIVFGASSGAIGVRTLDPRISLAVRTRARAAAQQLPGGSGS